MKTRMNNKYDMHTSDYDMHNSDYDLHNNKSGYDAQWYLIMICTKIIMICTIINYDMHKGNNDMHINMIWNIACSIVRMVQVLTLC